MDKKVIENGGGGGDRSSGSASTPSSPVVATPTESNGYVSIDCDSVDAKPMRSLTPPPQPTTAAAAARAIEDEEVLRRSKDDTDARGFNIHSYAKQLIGGGSGTIYIDEKDPFTCITNLEDDVYDLSEGKKIAIVFNHEKFHESRGLSARRGTESDCQAIEATFKKLLGFNLRTYDDLKVDDIRQVIRGLQHSREQISCLALFILTHGEENGVLHAYDAPYKLDREIINELLPEPCPVLAGKPKMIFIQACQGKETDEGAVIRSRSRHTSTDGLSGSNYRIPHYSDFLIFQAAYHGYYSFRSGSGSWFIQALCKCFECSKSGEDLHTTLTRAKHYVACYKISNVPSDPNLDRKKQIPLVQDTLIRALYLKGKPLTDLGEGRLSTSESRTRGVVAVTPETKRRTDSMKDAAVKSPKKEKKVAKGGGVGGDDKCICM